MAGSTKSPGNMQGALQAFYTGLKTAQLPSTVTQITADGKTSSIADLATEVSQMLSLYTTEADLKRQHDAALRARDNQAAAIGTRYDAVARAMKAALGKHSPHLASFGLKPDKVPAALTTEQVQARNALAKATRAARHTVGKKQKKAIKGTVPTNGTSANGSSTPTPTAPSK